MVDGRAGGGSEHPEDDVEVFQKRKLDLVSLWEGREPSAASRADVEVDMAAVRSFVFCVGGGGRED